MKEVQPDQHTESQAGDFRKTGKKLAKDRSDRYRGEQPSQPPAVSFPFRLLRELPRLITLISFALIFGGTLGFLFRLLDGTP
jgi:hypothetical protein